MAKATSASDGVTQDERLRPKENTVHEIRVEQIESEAETSRSGEPARGTTNRMQRLPLPENETDETSESTSQLSPRDGSNTDVTDDDSIAVSCHANPSEVIVKGKNVKKIRVRFPPHPPPSSDATRTHSGRCRPHRCQSGGSVKDDPTEPTNQSSDENLPYSKEETPLPAIGETSGGQLGASFQYAPSYSAEDPEDGGGLLRYTTSAASRSTYSLIDMDLKHRQDILSGLDYFERKAAEFKSLYNRSQRELENLKLVNLDLESRLRKLTAENEALVADSDEIQNKFDESEKENEILRGQAYSEWQSRVKIEEMYVELRRDSEREIAALRKQLADSCDQTDAGDKMASTGSEVKGQDEFGERAKEPLSEETFELKHTVSRLTEDINRLLREKDSLRDTNSRLLQDIDRLKGSLEDKDKELSSQSRQFTSLKKNFSSLLEENDALKVSLRKRGAAEHHVTRAQEVNVLANSTWPARRTTAGGLAEVERVSYIDLPNNAIAPTGGKTTALHQQQKALRSRRNSISSKLGMAAAVHSDLIRPTRETLTATDNLPPVNKLPRQ